jgi:lipoprotein-releasing system permease protein
MSKHLAFVTLPIPWPLVLALRYLRSARKDSFVSFLSTVAVGGISLGVAALLVALAGLSGLQVALRAEVLARTSTIELEGGAPELEQARRDLTGASGVQSVERRLSGTGWVLASGSVRPVEIVGFDGSLPERFPDATGRDPGIYVSDRLARLYGLQQGRRFELASARPTLSPIGPVPRRRRFELTGVFDGGGLERREVLAMPFDEAQDLLGSGSLRLVVTTAGLDEALIVAERIRPGLPAGVRLRTWQDLNAPLLFALQLEKRLMFVAVFLVVMVGALALVSDLSLIISSRRPEIGILGTMGADPASLRRVFLALGGLLGGIGVTIGTGLGLVSGTVLDRFRLIRLPGDAYLLDHVPFHFELTDIGLVLGATLLVSLACAWYGAGRAAAVRPVEALRS